MGDVVDMESRVHRTGGDPSTRYVHDDGRECRQDAPGLNRWTYAVGVLNIYCSRPHSLAERLPHTAKALSDQPGGYGLAQALGKARDAGVLSADEADVSRLERELRRDVGRFGADLEHDPLADHSSVADEATALVYGDREDDYGHPRQGLTRVAQVWTGLLGDKLEDGAFITPEDVARLMAGMKLARDVHEPKRDNRVDAIGYLVNLDRLETGR